MDCPGKYFNSRPHGGRPCAHCIIHFINCISTHALTEGDRIGQAVHNTVNISTHALTEGDFPVYSNLAQPIIFQLTPSRRATVTVLIIHTVYDISTHALTEGDGRRIWKRVTVAAFQLTPSRRATALPLSSFIVSRVFQLTPSRRATDIRVCFPQMKGISTHALTEGDKNKPIPAYYPRNFNSRPHGGRPSFQNDTVSFANISTHALTEGDKLFDVGWIKSFTFQLTPSRRATF